MSLRNRHLLFSDVILLPLAVYASFGLRLDEWTFSTPLTAPLAATCGWMCLFAGTIMPLIFFAHGLYSRYWPYASVEELLLLVYDVTLATLVVGLLGRMLPVLFLQVPPVPGSVLVIFWLLALAVTATPRLMARLWTRYRVPPGQSKSAQPVLIAGAGEAGVMVVRELQRNPHLDMQVVGFVDDDQTKQSMRIHGVPVLGARYSIPELTRKYGVTRVIIAMPKAPGKTIREVVDICKSAGVETKIMPGLYELLGGTVSVNQLRNVEIEDLLRREPIQTDLEAVRRLLRGKRVLVTGGGGSIGSELCRQVLRCEPAQLVVLGHGENSVFEIYNELRRLWPGGAAGDKLAVAVADIRFPDRLRDVFRQHRPQVVFHAAAHKHVPMMEQNSPEAITNNVVGTRNLLEVAAATGVERFVMISTDKAVNPTSIMGASKRAAELEMLDVAQRTGRPFVAVRFGNVLGSRGSVVLTFKQQIAAGGPVTVTHPEMTRYFMTIPEAVQLVLQAAVLGQGGEIFMLDMGEPVKILDLARDMIRLSGLEEGRDIDIIYTGIRPGEKLYEELFLNSETYRRTRHEKVFIAEDASTAVPADLDAQVAMLEATAHRGDSAEISNLLRRLVPEYRPVNQAAEVEVAAPPGSAQPITSAPAAPTAASTLATN